MRVGFLTTHPIQYQVPLFRELAKAPEIDLTVFFCMVPDERQQGDGFGVPFKWDIPLLEGYRYEVLDNVAEKPAVTTFGGCDTPDIWDIVREGGFDAFIVNGWVAKSCIQLLLACRRFKVPCIVRGESNSLRSRAWWKRMIHRQLLSKYSAFLSIGKANRDFYLQNGIPKEKIFFAPYCVENERFEAETSILRARRGELREAWGIPKNAISFLFCAKFIGKKRPMDLLRAFAIASGKMNEFSTPVHLLMVGDGELKKECELYASNNKLPVTFAGFLNQSEIVRAYAASDCLVLPSDLGETWGLVVNEAMACGLPAITSDRVGCHCDLVRSGETGEVFPFGDIKTLSDLFVSLASKPGKLREMGIRAKEIIKQYSLSHAVSGCMEAIKHVCV